MGNPKSSFKGNARTFSKSSTTQKNFRISKPKKSLWNLYKKKISNQKSNECLKTYKMNFINKKTNKQKVLNLVLTLGRSWRAKKAPKLSSDYLNFLAKFSYEIIKFRWNYKILKQIINLRVMKALRQNFKFCFQTN